ncbi:hypothetical protein CBS101457_006398 [Exobasidium rhododendri]|nr:hypothetical protein CBS101457_006398 [Exobasidium rhododendri]
MPSATHGQSTTGGAVKGIESSTKASGSNLAYVPRDARLVALILDSMGIEDVQPPVLMMLLEFAHRYLYEVLQDSLVYADHANSSKTTNAGVSTLTLEDIQLAIQSRVNHSFTGPPSKEMLLSLASSLNSVPLPPILDRYGMKLPPPKHCLTNVNFSLVPNPPPQDSLEDDAPGEDDEDDMDALERGNAANLIDGEMETEAEAKSSGVEGAGETASLEQRGRKRSLDEDEDYD